MKILMLTPYVPYPLLSGGQIRTYNLVKRLSTKHEFTLVCFYREEKEKQHKEKLKEIFKEIYFIKKKKPWTLTSLTKSVGKYPLLMNLYDLKDAKELLAFLLKNDKWDLIHCEPFYIMQILPEKVEPPVLLVEHNIEYLAYKRYVVNQKIPFLKPFMNLDIIKIKKWEEKFWKKADHVVAVSESDQKIIEKIKPKTTSVIPNGVDLNYFFFSPKINTNEKTILFIGDFKWFPNLEAVTYLKENLWPEIKKRVDTKIKLLIVGKFVPDKIKKWADKDIEVEENIPDIRIAYRSSDILLAPIWSGGGTKYKILEAMTNGCPVVTTPLGIEGIEAEDGSEVLIGNSKEELLEKTAEILSDESLKNRIVTNARLLVEKYYSWEKISSMLDSVYEECKK